VCLGLDRPILLKFVYTITDNRVTRLAIKSGLTDNSHTEVTAGVLEETPVVATIESAPPAGTPIQPGPGR